MANETFRQEVLSTVKFDDGSSMLVAMERNLTHYHIFVETANENIKTVRFKLFFTTGSYFDAPMVEQDIEYGNTTKPAWYIAAEVTSMLTVLPNKLEIIVDGTTYNIPLGSFTTYLPKPFVEENSNGNGVDYKEANNLLTFFANQNAYIPYEHEEHRTVTVQGKTLRSVVDKIDKAVHGSVRKDLAEWGSTLANLLVGTGYSQSGYDTEFKYSIQYVDPAGKYETLSIEHTIRFDILKVPDVKKGMFNHRVEYTVDPFVYNDQEYEVAYAGFTPVVIRANYTEINPGKSIREPNSFSIRQTVNGRTLSAYDKVSIKLTTEQAEQMVNNGYFRAWSRYSNGEVVQGGGGVEQNIKINTIGVASGFPPAT